MDNPKRELIARLVSAMDGIDTHVEPNGVWDFCGEGECEFCNALKAGREYLENTPYSE